MNLKNHEIETGPSSWHFWLQIRRLMLDGKAILILLPGIETYFASEIGKPSETHNIESD